MKTGSKRIANSVIDLSLENCSSTGIMNSIELDPVPDTRKSKAKPLFGLEQTKPIFHRKILSTRSFASHHAPTSLITAKMTRTQASRIQHDETEQQERRRRSHSSEECLLALDDTNQQLSIATADSSISQCIRTRLTTNNTCSRTRTDSNSNNGIRVEWNNDIRAVDIRDAANAATTMRRSTTKRWSSSQQKQQQQQQQQQSKEHQSRRSGTLSYFYYSSDDKEQSEEETDYCSVLGMCCALCGKADWKLHSCSNKHCNLAVHQFCGIAFRSKNNNYFCSAACSNGAFDHIRREVCMKTEADTKEGNVAAVQQQSKKYREMSRKEQADLLTNSAAAHTETTVWLR